MTEEQHPTDEELFAIYNSAEGDGSSYEGWLALYRAGVAEGRRQAEQDVRTENYRADVYRKAWHQAEEERDAAREALPET